MFRLEADMRNISKIAIAMAAITCTTPAVFGQQSGSETQRLRVVPRVLGRKPAPPSALAPNERVSFNKDGDIVIEGARRRDSTTATLVIERNVHVAPHVTATVRPTGNGFTYEYQIGNGPDAKQWIQLFWIDAFGPVTSTRVPQYWFVYNIDKTKPPIERIFIGRSGTDTDQTLRLSPGTSQSGFVVESPARPGLVRISFHGHKPLSGEPGFRPEEAAAFSPEVEMSDALRQEMNNLLSLDKSAVTIYAIGPKAAQSIPAVQAVRAELLEALRVPAFMPDRTDIDALLMQDDNLALTAGLQKLADKGAAARPVGPDLASELYTVLSTYLR